MIKSLFLFAFSFFALLMLSSCAAAPKLEAPGDFNATPSDPSFSTDESSDNYEECRDPEDPCVNYSGIYYRPPDTEKVISVLASARETVEENSLPYNTQMASVEYALGFLSEFETMRSYAEIEFYKNKGHLYMREEYSRLYKSTPEILFATDELFSAIEESANYEAFMYDLLNKEMYREKNFEKPLTDAALAILIDEAKLESYIFSLCRETVTISHDGFSGTLGIIKPKLADKYGAESAEYAEAISICEEKYETKLRESYIVNTIELFKLRTRFAGEMGYSGYYEYVFDNKKDYSADELDLYIKGITGYTVPVYEELGRVFERYFYTNAPLKIGSEEVMNFLDKWYSSMDNSLWIHFSHLTSGGLYYIGGEGDTAIRSALTSHLRYYRSSFVFIDLDGGISDYGKVARGLGRFCAGHGKKSMSDDCLYSLSGEAVRMMTVASISKTFSEEDCKNLLYSELDSAMSEMILKAYYAYLEKLIYNLPYESIDRENVEAIAREAAANMGIDLPSFDMAMTEPLVLDPFRSAADSISLFIGLEIFSEENEKKNAGLDLFNKISAFDLNETLDEQLKYNGFSSPFSSESIKTYTDKIHFLINGYYFFDKVENTPGEA